MIILVGGSSIANFLAPSMIHTLADFTNGWGNRTLNPLFFIFVVVLKLNKS